MKKRAISFLLVFCLLACGAFTPAAVTAESAEAPVTAVTDVSGELEWTLVSTGDELSGSTETKGGITIAVTYSSITVLDAHSQPLATYTANDLLGEMTETENQHGYFGKLFVMDDAFYIMYGIEEVHISGGGGGASFVKGGLLRTIDGVTFENLALPVRDVIDTSYSIKKYNDTYILYCNWAREYTVRGDDTAIVSYYISNDLETWTACQSPALSHGEDTVESFTIATITEKGVYFTARSYEMRGAYDADLGIYFTDDFQTYTCITESIYSRGEFNVAPSRADLPGNTIAILACPSYWSDYLSDQYDLYLYHEQTGEMTHILRTEEVRRNYLYNFSHVDPLTLYVRPVDSDDSFVVYSASSQNPSATVKYTIPYSWSELTREFKWWNWDFDDKIYSFDSLFMTDGTQAYMLVSSDYWKTAYRFDIGSESVHPSKVKSISYTHASEDAEATMWLVCDNGTYTCSLRDVTSYLTPLTTLKDEETGVSVISSTNGALPEGAELDVTLVSDDDGAVVYDINLLKDKTAVQPIYPVYVQIPIPAERIDSSYRVYRVETDGTKTTMKAETVDGHIRFATDHFSQYVVEWTAGSFLGDLDGNGVVEAYDYILLKRYILGTYDLPEERLASADVDQNGTVEAYDYILLKRHILGTYQIEGLNK